MSALPLDEIKARLRLGEVAGEFEYRVEANDLARFRAAIDAPLGPDDDPELAPPTYFALLDPMERGDLASDAFVYELPFPMTGGGNAFNEVEYDRPIRVGDVLTVTTRFTEVYEKQGRQGTLLFRVRENEIRDASGERVAKTRLGHVLSFEIAS